MKHEEEWLEEMFGRNNWAVADTLTLKAIQLEAFKAGAEWAAGIYTVEMRKVMPFHIGNTELEITLSILSAAQQLADIPK